MKIAGQVNGTFAVDRVPPRRVGHTVKLGFKTDFHRGGFSGFPDNPPGGFPGGPAGCTPQHFNLKDLTIVNRYGKFGTSEPIAIPSQAVLPG